jgi:hypothetical protein
MQTYLNKNTTFFQRLLKLSEYKGFNSLNKFAIEGLNYSSSEKLNRLKKENTNPSVDILLDISNKFEDINFVKIDLNLSVSTLTPDFILKGRE